MPELHGDSPRTSQGFEMVSQIATDPLDKDLENFGNQGMGVQGPGLQVMSSSDLHLSWFTKTICECQLLRGLSIPPEVMRTYTTKGMRVKPYLSSKLKDSLTKHCNRDNRGL